VKVGVVIALTHARTPWIHLLFSFHSIRAAFGTDVKKNAVHASDSEEVAARELAFFMPKFRIPYVPGTEPPIQRTLALIRPNALAEHRGKHKVWAMGEVNKMLTSPLLKVGVFHIIVATYNCSMELISFVDSIIGKIKEAGFEIAYEKEMVLTKEQAEEFYREHQDKEFFDSLTTQMSRYRDYTLSLVMAGTLDGSL
jgi:nucleoside diphosphate kinase